MPVQSSYSRLGTHNSGIITGIHTIKRRVVSIQWTLPLCVITPLVAGIGLTGWLAFSSGQRAVDELVESISKEVATNIEKQVKSYLDKPVSVSAALVADVTDTLRADSVRSLSSTFWQLTQIESLTDNLYYGSELGEFVYGEYQRQTQQSRLAFLDEETDFKRFTYKANTSGEPTEKISEVAYDPRERPWYPPAVEAGAAVWSPVYVAQSTGDLTITRATPIYDENQQLKGVFGTDVYLNALSDFMREMNISENSRAFIVELSGDIIASSADEKPFVEGKTEKLRLAATLSQDELIRESVNLLQQRKGGIRANLPAASSYDSFDFELNGQKQLYMYHFQDAGVDWLIGIAIAQDDYMGTIRANMRRTIVVGLVITLTASLLALAAAWHIIRPIRKLTQAAYDIKDNRFNPDNLADVIARLDEFSDLAELFNDMATVVVSREQSLEEQVRLLKTEIDLNGNRQGDRKKIQQLLERSQRLRAIQQSQQ